MKAITVIPGKTDQVAVSNIAEPSTEPGSLLVEARLLGICGTDAEIVLDGYGAPPPGNDRLIVGHESLGEVRHAPPGSGFAAGDLVAGIVRRPDPVPCKPCSRGEWDFCENGLFTERGIKERDGFGSQLWTIEPECAVKLDISLGDCGVLLEPASVLAKAWEQTDRIFARASWRPHIALICGAGPIGLLAALMAVQRGLEVHVLDLAQTGPKPQLVADLGATFHSGDVADLDFAPETVIDTTGHGQLVSSLPYVTAPNAVICLAGISSATTKESVSIDELNDHMVLNNTVMFGTVNANRRHFEKAAVALAQADHEWLERLITRRVPMEDFSSALHKESTDVKVVVDMQA